MSSDGGVFLQYKKETMQVIAYDLHDGSIKYITNPRNASDWGMYTSGWCIDSAYDRFYVGAYDGYIMAYDIETGNEHPASREAGATAVGMARARSSA